jgi:hypothetical protein
VHEPKRRLDQRRSLFEIARDHPAVKPNKKPKPDNPAQSKAFMDKAKEIEADERESASDTLIGRLAKHPPEPRTKKEKPGN